jgi:DNA polymerase
LPTELEELATIAASCTDCELSKSRTNVVFGDGDHEADLMFIGEGPGFHEDQQGLPFVGKSGQLLETLLSEIGLHRKEVYIANVVKCRPPGNRDPRPDEIEACKGYLRRQLELIQPRVVVTLGNFSTKLLLKTDTGITKLRGRAYPWWGRHLVPTFHPAAGLRGGPRVVDQLREDFRIVGELLSSPPAAEPAEDAAAEQLGLFR